MASSERTPSDVDRIAEGWVDTLVELEPGHRHLHRSSRRPTIASPTTRPPGTSAHRRDATTVLARFAPPSPSTTSTASPSPTSAASSSSSSRATTPRLHLRDLNVIASPAQEIREVFDLMPTATARRLGAHRRRGSATCRRAIDGYIETLRAGIARGRRPRACGRSREVAAQARKHRAARRVLRARSPRTRRPATASCPTSLARASSTRGAPSAGIRLRRPRRVPRERARSRSRPSSDAVGRDIYALQSRHFLGAVIDLDETYEWGIEELARMVAEQEAIASEIKPGRIRRRGDRVPRRRPSPQAARHRRAAARGCRRRSDRAVAELGATHFDIPDRDPHARVHDRADPGGRHLLHGPERRLLAARPHVVVACPRASPSSTPGASSRPSTTRACPAITCRSARPSYNRAQAQHLAPPARRHARATPRAGRSTPSGSWRSSATSTTRPTGSACSTASACARPASCSTSACTSASSGPTATGRGRASTRSSSCARTST